MKLSVLKKKLALVLLFSVPMACENCKAEERELNNKQKVLLLEATKKLETTKKEDNKAKDLEASQEFVSEIIENINNFTPKTTDENIVREKIKKAIPKINKIIEDFSPHGDVGQIIIKKIQEAWKKILDIIPTLEGKFPTTIKKELMSKFEEFAQDLEDLINELEKKDGTEKIVEILSKKLAEIQNELNLDKKNFVIKCADWIKTKTKQAFGECEKLALAKALRMGVL